MKIETSFVIQPGRSTPWLALGLAAFALILLIIAIVLAGTAWRLRAEQVKLDARLADVKRAAQQMTETPLPPQSDLHQLRSRVAAINQITGVGGDTLIGVVKRIENSLPDEVALTNLRYQRRQGEIVIVAEASRADMLTETLQKLEQHAAFREIQLVRQSERASGRGGVQFELRLKD